MVLSSSAQCSGAKELNKLQQHMHTMHIDEMGPPPKIHYCKKRFFRHKEYLWYENINRDVQCKQLKLNMYINYFAFEQFFLVKNVTFFIRHRKFPWYEIIDTFNFKFHF